MGAGLLASAVETCRGHRGSARGARAELVPAPDMEALFDEAPIFGSNTRRKAVDVAREAAVKCSVVNGKGRGEGSSVRGARDEEFLEGHEEQDFLAR